MEPNDQLKYGERVFAVVEIETNNLNGVKAYNFGFRHLDSPNTTSSTTYKLQVGSRSSVEFNLNRASENFNEVYMIGQTSAITLYEVTTWA